jgi:hypothetical protein
MIYEKRTTILKNKTNIDNFLINDAKGSKELNVDFSKILS